MDAGPASRLETGIGTSSRGGPVQSPPGHRSKTDGSSSNLKIVLFQLVWGGECINYNCYYNKSIYCNFSRRFYFGRDGGGPGLYFRQAGIPPAGREFMSETPSCAHGDFSNLAANYSKYRAGYAPSVLASIFKLIGRPWAELDVVDVGAGTGIWTRMMAEAGCRKLTAVEPNDAMRQLGIRDSEGYTIKWVKGSGEATGLPARSHDLLTMASSFHWVDFDQGVSEFQRVLRDRGWFVALWNPRLIEENPLLVEIEERL